MTLLEVYVSSGPQETHAYAACFAKALLPNSIVALKGDLGAGKTTWVRGMVEGLGLDPRVVSSPTFTLLNIYPSEPPFYHFDLYRLPSSEEFCKAGFDDYLRAGGICCVEWAEKIDLPPDTYQIVFSYTGQDTRHIRIEGPSI
jgi:tRNA threonylcarbamoyladenosine biosynthesis protein TsaE